MYRFLLSPRWVATHALVVGLAALFIVLGFWQLSRHFERDAHNTLVAQRTQVPVQPLETALAEVGGDADALRYRRVTVTGRYDPDDEVLLSPRARDGRPGHHVLTPLVSEDGRAVLVDRGWVPYEHREEPDPAAAAPTGPVTVEGLVLPDEPPVRFSPAIPEGRVASVSRVDVARLQEQVDAPLRRFYVQLQEQQPTSVGGVPAPVPPPELDAGPHLSYAGQWFIFATIGVVGYPLLVRRLARDRRARAEEETTAAPAGQPAGRP